MLSIHLLRISQRFDLSNSNLDFKVEKVLMTIVKSSSSLVHVNESNLEKSSIISRLDPYYSRTITVYTELDHYLHHPSVSFRNQLFKILELESSTRKCFWMPRISEEERKQVNSSRSLRAALLSKEQFIKETVSDVGLTKY